MIATSFCPHRISIITGHYGTGKTEFAVNLAMAMAAEGQPVMMADLDIVNPYFRSRERRTMLEQAGVQLISSSQACSDADVPSLPAELLAIFENRDIRGILDIGGDPVGARVLARFRPKLLQEDHQLIYVLNANRPETRDLERALAYMRGIEAECHQKVTGIVNNTHLCGETTAAEILKGARLAGQLSQQTRLPVVCHAAQRRLLPEVQNTLIEPILPMDLYMKKPWEITTCEEEHLLWPEP